MIVDALRKLKGLIRFGKGGHSLRDLPWIKGKLYVNQAGRIRMGKRVRFVGRPWATQLTVDKGALLEIGDRTFINAGVGIAVRQSVTIGDNVKIGPRTSILDSTYHQLDASDSPGASKPIVIRNNVWIGTRCTILPGVTIGENSVVAAGSIVNKDVPRNVLVAGTPARVIRELDIPAGWIRQ
ncbi:acyltransferase [Paenibacillus sacheonensis]|uniref:Acetyltransferase n=1 Tax=Paenibacillus sacheonensis TaxID=742054 RepID=A0A7X5C010_9BACL|nr:DapH/DapD/GlmU-related protein [Paenibacillus sacheonensis]MBM7563618.1 maltose O-acetyltransferase [Paenibacillus sacheonensis]NBC71086.1 acetyltransferase [Paenibacillus sacheonensis]